MPKSTPISPVTPTRKRDSETGPESAGQSGDIQGLPENEDVENESVRELVEEGQYFEASLVEGIENAEDAPPSEKLRPRRRPEDDLPPEYADQPKDEPKE